MTPLHENSENELENEEIIDVIEVDEEADNAVEENDDSIQQILAHSDDVLRVVISDSLRWLVTGSMDDNAAVFDIQSESFDEPCVRINHADSVEYVAFNHNNTLLATGDLKGKIFITRLEKKTVVCEILDCFNEQSEEEAPESLKFLFWHKSADILLAGTGEGIIWKWNIADDAVSELKIFTCATNESVNCAKLIPNSNQLLAAYQDGYIRTWDLETTAKKELNLGSPCILLDVYQKSNIAAVGLENETVALVQIEKNTVFARFGEPHNKNEQTTCEITTISFCESYPWLAIGKEDGVLTIYDINTKTSRISIQHDGNAIVSVLWRLSLEGIWIISTTYDGKMQVMDARDGKILKIFSAATEIFELIKFDQPNEPLKLVAACADGVVKVFSL